MDIKKIEIAGSKRAHRDWVNKRNLGMNQATAQRTSVKPAAAIKAPKPIDAAHEDFSACQELFPKPTTSLCSFISRLSGR
jgi:hypothetical protein